MSLHDTATWAEIQQQPDLWDAWARDPAIGRARDWLRALAPNEAWLCGAGSSAFVGDVVAAGVAADVPGPRLRALPTTDLVSRPRAYLPTDALVLQFGRSGDSAESVGLMDALDALSPATPRLHVTCNPRGALATRPAPGPLHALVLPEAAHDRGFAMTSSFTTMLLSALAILTPEGAAPIAALADRLRALLPAYESFAHDARSPERLVFLGTGPLAHAAREAALKVMELTAGGIPCLWDSVLGFRHGPKSFMRGATDVVMFASGDPHARRYEADLGAELRAQYPGSRITVLGPGGDLADDLGAPSDAWAAAVLVPFAQVLAATLAHRLGHRVDDPFAGTGQLSRVVRGVRLHAP